MRILLVLPYGPSQTRIRSRMLLTELAPHHNLTIVGLTWNHEEREAFEQWSVMGHEVHIIPHGIHVWTRAALRSPRPPLQRLISASPSLAQLTRALLERAHASGKPYDAVHVEHLRGAASVDLLSGLPTRTIFDAVDCIAELARLTRIHNPRRVVRLLAGFEESSTRRLESQLVDAADIVTVVAERDRQALLGDRSGEHVRVVPNGVACLSKPVELTTDPIAVFTGKLSYHANQAALKRLLDDIWPRTISLVPDARLVIAGAHAPGWLADWHGRMGVSVHSNPPEMAPIIASARAAVAPMVYSVGIQNKILEAMACGVPVVTTSTAMEGLLPSATRTVLTADDDVLFAFHLARLLTEPQLARTYGRSGYEYVFHNHSWAEVARTFESLYAARPSIQKAA